MERKIRFGELVEKAGRPRATTLWVDPRKDRAFSQAIEQNRILTVVQEPTTKHKDFGLIGYRQEPHATYLIFPRPLPRDGDSRVVGIKYDLVDEAAVGAPVRESDLKRVKRAEKPKPAERVQKSFTIKVRRMAAVETSVKIRAEDRAAAEKAALESVKSQSFDLAQAQIRQEVVR
jgi:hypothetical protein